MDKLTIDDQGLLIPRRLLADFPTKVTLRPVKGGLIIEPLRQTAIREELQAMVSAIQHAAADDMITETEITDLVNQVREDRAGHR